MSDERVLVLMPTTRDGERTRAALDGAGLAAVVCSDMGGLCREIHRGAGAALLTEDAITSDGSGCLVSALREQPPWSDLPLIVLAREGSTDGHLREAMNATLVERPVKVRSLVSVIRAALRARRRQYEVRDHLAEQRRGQEAQAYLVKLADALRPLSDPIELQAAANRVLGEHLGANRVAYFEIAGPDYVVERDYAAGVGSLAGRYPVASFGAALLASFLAGRTVVETDATAAPARPADERAAFAAIRCRGHVDVPLVKAGAFVAGMTVHCCTPREWTADEVTLIEQTAERTWAAVERTRAEAAVARLAADADRERRLFAAVLNSAPDFIYTFDLAGRFVYINAALLALWGKRPDEAVGRNFFDLDYPPALADRLQRQIRQVIDTRQPLRDETPYTSRVGERMYEYIFVPVVGAGAAVEAVAGATRDITDRKRSEEERERLVGQLQDQDRRKDEFLATLAHELRNPLAPIRNGVQVLKLSGRAEDRAVAMMDRQLTHMVRLIDDLLDVSRIGRNKMELRRTRVTLAEVIASAVETAQPAIDASGHELAVTLPGRPVELDADLTRLAQVFSNLLTNSAKYTHRGGKIWLTADLKGEAVSVSVRDTGIGIPAASLPTIFDMFSQVDRSIERSTGGLGIGLSLVKGLTEMHGGTVTAASDDAGSTFTVTFPVLATKTEVRVEAVSAASNGQAHKILVVDDNRDGADSLSQLLEILGHEVRIAYDGVEAVAAARECRPDVILMDVGMPRLNGYEATRQIRAQDWGAGVTIIALTGWGQDGDRKLSKEAGCNGHLVKPVSLSDLETMLSKLGAAK